MWRIIEISVWGQSDFTGAFFITQRTHVIVFSPLLLVHTCELWGCEDAGRKVWMLFLNIWWLLWKAPGDRFYKTELGFVLFSVWSRKILYLSLRGNYFATAALNANHKSQNLNYPNKIRSRQITQWCNYTVTNRCHTMHVQFYADMKKSHHLRLFFTV